MLLPAHPEEWSYGSTETALPVPGLSPAVHHRLYNLGCLPEIRSPVIVLTLNGCGVRDLQRALHVSPNTILKVIREEAAAVPEPAPAAPHPHSGT